MLVVGLSTLKLVKGSSVPSRCYAAVPDGKSGNLKLAVGCVYCRHKGVCWSDANQGKGIRTFKYSNGTRENWLKLLRRLTLKK